MRIGSRRSPREHNRGGGKASTADRAAVGPARARAARRAVAVIGAVGLLAVTGCGSTTLDDIKVGPGKGWPVAYHDGRNSAATAVEGSRHLVPHWNRPLGGPAAVPTIVGPGGQLWVTTRLPTDCVGNPAPSGAMFSFQMPTGRKRFCNPMGPDALAAGAAVDGIDNVYVGDNGGVFSYNALGQPRWRTPVAGVPVSVQFTGEGDVLSVTQSGQIDVLDRQTGDLRSATFQALGEPDFLRQPDLPRPPDGQGIGDCVTGGPQCPVSNVSAIEHDSGRFYLTLRRPGAPIAALVALRYADKRIQQDWSVDILTDGSATSPALAPDGKTVYIGDNSGRLLAVDAADGRVKWSWPLGFAPQGTVSVRDGLLIPGGDEGHLLALHDDGDSARIAWERKDLPLRGRPVQTAGNTGYTVAPIGPGLSLVTFDTGDGSTVATNELPGAQGSTVGTAVSDNREVVVTTRIGELFTFEPEDD
ncbi:PQQ-binding-like beta-propeller repeat protein [Nocardia sp. BMG51109]|uniref:outer membrane protein assembly factor BamB family protein n=1 Tax=Nocardia sp. BMG51109 TaxID=1056816 RepID=UPI0004BA2254|nr:PQQ-binding-like beta-propeller repeat protein [Nocardia sp. BMG51109]